MEAKINISTAHAEALAVIMSEAYPYADNRNLSPIFEVWIEDYLLREGGRLGRIVNGEYRVA